MAKITLFLLVLLTTSVKSQTLSLKEEWPSIVTSALSGGFDGTAETLKFHYPQFKKTFPNAKPEYWHMETSWVNKYKNGDPNQGPKYLGSTTFLVWTTDGYHLARFGKNTMMLTTFLIHPRQKKKFKHYLLDIAVHTAAYHIGFYSTYNILFKK